mgnify:CR=1 FL=1
MASPDICIAPGEARPLGVTLVPGGINVAVVSRHAERIELCLFDASGAEELARLILPGRNGDVHHGFVAGVGEGTRYGLRAHGPWDPANGHRFDPAKLLVDPYARELDRPFAHHPDLTLPHDVAVDTARLVPKAIVRATIAAKAIAAGSLPPCGGGLGWGVIPSATPTSRAPPPPCPSPLEGEGTAAESSGGVVSRAWPGLIYEIAVKAFTHQHPEIPEHLRGTLAAVAHPAIIAHLHRIGADTVELMPLAAWIDERHLPPLGLTNAWGYNPVTFLAPDPRIVPGGMREVQDTVAALHAAGIRVLLDVVLNHTGESDTYGATLSLRGLDNALYYRHEAAAPGHLVNDTGCGNTLALDRTPVAQLAMDALRHWASAGIDGFRFDLATVLGRTERGFTPEAPLLTAIAQDPELGHLMLIAEPWDIGPEGYRLGGFREPWHEWSDRYRDDVRRFWRGDAAAVGALATRLTGSSDIFRASHRPPSRSINYIAAHDGFTLADVVSYAVKRNAANGEDNRDGTNENHSWNGGAEGATSDPAVLARRRRDRQALLATLFLSRGTPMLTAGDEMGRTQQGNNNAYAQDNRVTWLDWEGADQDGIELVARLSRLRAKHPCLTVDEWLTGRVLEDGPPDAAWLKPDGSEMRSGDWDDPSLTTLGLALFRSAAPGGDDDRLCLWLNRGETAVAVSPPEPKAGCLWRVLLRSETADPAAEAMTGETVEVEARSVLVLGEVPAAARLSRAASDAQVAELAAAAGIHPDWYEVDGTHHWVSPESQRAVLAAMHVPCASAEDARHALAQLQVETKGRALPLTQLMRAGSAGAMRVASPLSRGERRLALTITLEDGSIERVTCALGAACETGRAVVGGETFVQRSLPLPPLPAGLHTAALEDQPEAVCTIVSAPPAAVLTGGVENGARLYGLTSHLYALRHQGDAGIGDLATLAHFARVSARLGGALAGINPLHHMFPTDRERASPYQPADRRYLDPIYIDLAGLAEVLPGGVADDILGPLEARLPALRRLSAVDYTGVWAVKRPALEAAFGTAVRAEENGRSPPGWSDFLDFERAGGESLRLHGVFEALADAAGSVDRQRWPAGWRDPLGADVVAFAAAHAREVRFRIWLQWLADRQLASAAARGRAAGLSLGLYRDLAVGTALDGGEIWEGGERFANGVSLGAPPDPFSSDGQVWNLARFDPLALARTGYRPLASLLAANMRHAGVLRIDHILGFMRQFLVPLGAPGSAGAYVDLPIDTLIGIAAIESQRAGCMVIGEDLGTVPDGLRSRMDAASILAYRVLWFERQGLGFLPPSTYPRLATCCLSSHDLPTFRGWRRGRDIEIDRDLGRLKGTAIEARGEERTREMAALGQVLAAAGIAAGVDETGASAAVHELVARAPSAIMLVQVDDLVGETEPLNVPGTDRERPNWRRRLEAPIDDLPTDADARDILAAVRRGRGIASR